MGVVDRSYDHPLKIEERACAPLAGGILLNGYQCGMLWGAAFAAGAQAYQLLGPGPQAETKAVLAAQKLVGAFQNHSKNEINCLEISDLNITGQNQALPILKFFLKGGPIGCFTMAAHYAPDAQNQINLTLSGNDFKTSSPPVSCAALFAKKMGASELYTVMSAGLAGGIGLSGGACGLLGAAIWLHGIKNGKDGNVKSVDEHAEYLGAGGCWEIIDGLAAQF